MNPLFIPYIVALIETIISPPGCKLFYCAEMPQFLQAVGSNGLPQHRTRLKTSLDSASIAVMLHSVIFLFYQTATSSKRRF